MTIAERRNENSLYNHKLNFAKSLGCRNVSEAVDKLGGVRVFNEKYLVYCKE